MAMFPPKNGRPPFNSETSRNLLMCLVWVLRWADRAALSAAVADLPPARLHSLFALIDLCFKCQEYKVSISFTLQCVIDNIFIEKISIESGSFEIL